MAASGMELYVDQESGDVIREAQEGVPTGGFTILWPTRRSLPVRG